MEWTWYVVSFSASITSNIHPNTLHGDIQVIGNVATIFVYLWNILCQSKLIEKEMRSYGVEVVFYNILYV